MEIISDTADFIPSVLTAVGLDPNLDLQQNYQQFIPLIFKSTTMDNSSLSLNRDTLSQFEQWQQHLSTDVDSTLNELMRLASQSHQLQQTDDHPNSTEPNPWLAISRLTETVANLTAKVLEQNDHLMALQSNTIPKPKPTKSSPSPQSEPTTEPTAEDTSPNLEALSSDELRNSRAVGAPTEKLNRALHAIIQYNQQQSEPKQMWRINAQVLMQLTGCFQANVKSFFLEHKDAIDHHNQQFHLTTVRHNASHNGQPPSDFIHW